MPRVHRGRRWARGGRGLVSRGSWCEQSPPWLLIGMAAAAVVVLAVVIGVASVLSGGGEKQDGSRSNKATAAASEKPSAAPTPAVAESAATEVITPQNIAEFPALLKADTCDDASADFAARHHGRTVAFHGSIVHMAPQVTTTPATTSSWARATRERTQGRREKARGMPGPASWGSGERRTRRIRGGWTTSQ
ncbi:DUF4839 domain-containing protein [Streptomyces phaeofaciens]|uniref:DUF4839 domain-containing protein n=1 Tax=Streptomyces phaeofaciens TaxID=68254 RepID=UPI00368A35F7